MEEQERDAYRFIAQGRGEAQTEEQKRELFRALGSERELFLQQHRKHLGCLREKTYVCAREVMIDIHYLLRLRTQRIFFQAEKFPYDEVSIRFAPAEEYAALYPGPRPANLVDYGDGGPEVWPAKLDYGGFDLARRDRIETRIDETPSVSSLSEPTEDWQCRLFDMLNEMHSVAWLQEARRYKNEPYVCHFAQKALDRITGS